MSITLRAEKQQPLSFEELDKNFCSLYFSSSLFTDNQNNNYLRLWYTGSSEVGDPGEFNLRYDEHPLGSGEGKYVTLTGDQTISGLKQFTNIEVNNKIIFNTSNQSLDYLNYKTLEGLTYFENDLATWRLSGGGASSFINGSNVGIGTTRPSEKLDVSGTIRANSFTDGAILTSDYFTEPVKIGVQGYIACRGIFNNSEIGPTPAAISFGNGASDDPDRISLITFGQVRQFIDPNGNIGIGTIDPQASLHIKGNKHDSTFTDGALIIEQGGDAPSKLYIDGNDIDTGGDSSLYVNDYSNNDIILGGNVGIGIPNPSEKLEVNGNIRIGQNQFFKAGNTWIRNNGSVAVISNQGNGVMLWRPNGDGSGSGEMKLNPSGDLEVNGTAKFNFRSGDYYTNAQNEPMLYFGTSSSNSAIISRASGNGQQFTWRDSNNIVVASLDANNGDLEVSGDVVLEEDRILKAGDTWVRNNGSIAVISNQGLGRMLFRPRGDNSSTDEMTLQRNGDLEVSGDVIAFSSSDKTLKENISNINNPVDKIKVLNGIYFNWKESDGRHNHKGKDIGVIAQEVESILPEIVTTRENGVKAIQYDKLIPLTIEAIKEQDKKIEDLQEQINEIKKLIK